MSLRAHAFLCLRNTRKRPRFVWDGWRLTAGQAQYPRPLNAFRAQRSRTTSEIKRLLILGRTLPRGKTGQTPDPVSSKISPHR